VARPWNTTRVSLPCSSPAWTESPCAAPASHLLDGHSYRHPHRRDATEDSHVEQGHLRAVWSPTGRRDTHQGLDGGPRPVEPHRAGDDPLMGGEGEQEEVDPGGAAADAERDPLEEVVYGESQHNQEAPGRRLHLALYPRPGQPSHLYVLLHREGQLPVAVAVPLPAQVARPGQLHSQLHQIRSQNCRQPSGL
jgi:hypothetical protein